MFISLISEFFNLVTLAGVIILSRQVTPFWQTVIGVTLIILGLIGAGS